MINNKPLIRFGMNIARVTIKIYYLWSNHFQFIIEHNCFRSVMSSNIRRMCSLRSTQKDDAAIQNKKGELTNRGKGLNTKMVRETSVFNIAYHR